MTDIAARIRKILETEKMSPSRFAEEIGVQRSSLSHILSGRNYPGYEYLLKILKRFPSLDANWLLMGEGEMYKSDKQTVDKGNKELFPDNATGYTEKTESLPDSSLEYEFQHKNVEEKEWANGDKGIGNDRFIIKIIEFYSDHTFNVFYPA